MKQNQHPYDLAIGLDLSDRKADLHLTDNTSGQDRLRPAPAVCCESLFFEPRREACLYHQNPDPSISPLAFRRGGPSCLGVRLANASAF